MAYSDEDFPPVNPPRACVEFAIGEGVYCESPLMLFTGDNTAVMAEPLELDGYAGGSTLATVPTVCRPYHDMIVPAVLEYTSSRNVLVGGGAFDPSVPPFNLSNVAESTQTLDGVGSWYFSGPRYVQVTCGPLVPGEPYALSFYAARQTGGSTQDVFVTIAGSTSNVGSAMGGVWSRMEAAFTAESEYMPALVRLNNYSEGGSANWVGHVRDFEVRRSGAVDAPGVVPVYIASDGSVSMQSSVEAGILHMNGVPFNISGRWLGNA